MSPNEIVDLIIQSEQEAQKQIWLIPSENLPSPFSRLALATSAVNRYLFKYQYAGARFCPGTEIYQQLHDFCVTTLKELFHARHVSLRPISGMNAMTLVITTYVDKDETMYAIRPAEGGHTHTEKIVAALGRRLRYIPMREEHGCFFVDYDRFAAELQQTRPKLVYLDPMSYAFQFDLPRIRQMAPDGCAVHYDTSHVMSFVVGGVYPNPLDLGYASVGGSTHKTLPSVQKAFFATNSDQYFDRFEKFSGQMLSSLHTASILALAVTLAETRAFFEKYAVATLANTRHAAERLEAAGFVVVGPPDRKTDCHVLFLEVEPHCPAVEACHRLARANIITHPIQFPLGKACMGLRLGFQEMTALGMGLTEVDLLAEIFGAVLIKHQDPALFADTIAGLRAKHRWPAFSFLDDQRLSALWTILFR